MKYVIFFDGSCSFCCQAVLWIYRHDRSKEIWFGPLEGATFQSFALERKVHLHSVNSLIFVEESHPYPRCFVQAAAVRKILWVLGGWHRLLTIFSYLIIASNFWYRKIAKVRNHLSRKKIDLSEVQRLLP